MSGVVREIRHAGAEAGIELGPDSPADRRALVHALRQLTDWGVITEDDGSVAGYADDPAAEALLWVDRELVRQLLAVPLREVTDPGALVRVASEPGPDGTRHAVRRRIVEEPVVIADELPEDERAWLRQYQRREAQLAEQLFGLRLEIRAEGIAAFDPLEELSDQTFPREGTLGQAALLSIAELVRRLRPAATANAREGLATVVGFDRGLLGEIVTELLARHGRRWSKEYTEHPNRLLADVEDYLVGMGLVALGADGALSLRAIAARYAPAVEARAPTTTYLRPRGDDMTDQLFGAPDAAVSAVSFDDETPSRIGRWVLNRAGIVNVWQYDRAEFRFAGGRALLRGKNGAGKSKALEVLLPFLLDGDTRTIDASGRDRTTVGWLMSDGREPGNHVGYVWLELRFTDEDGVDRFCTLGAGLKSSSSTKQTSTWFFLAEDVRVGADLALEEDGQCYSIERLKAQLGEQVTTSPAEHRRRVALRAVRSCCGQIQSFGRRYKLRA